MDGKLDLDALAEYLADQEGLLAAHLFGSRVTQEAWPGIDDEIIPNRLKPRSDYVDDLQLYPDRVNCLQNYSEDKRLRPALERALQVSVEIFPDAVRRIDRTGVYRGEGEL